MVEVNHYSVADFSEDEVNDRTEGPENCICHCKCGTEKIIMAVEIFILIAEKAKSLLQLKRYNQAKWVLRRR